MLISREAFCQRAGQSGSSSAGGSGTDTTQSSGAKGKSDSGAGSSNSSKAGASDAGGSAPAIFFESQILSYAAVDRITKQIDVDICTSLGSSPGTRVFVYDPATFANLQLVAGFELQIQLLTAAFNSFLAKPHDDSIAQQVRDLRAQVELLEQRLAALEQQIAALESNQPAPTLTAATTTPAVPFAKPAAILTALGPYLTASTTDKSGTFSLSDAAIAMSIVHHMHSDCTTNPPTLIYPRIALPPSGTSSPTTEDAITQLMSSLFAIQRQAATIVQAAEDEHQKTLGAAGSKAAGDHSQGSADQGTGGKGGDQASGQGAITKTLAGADYQSLSGATGLLNQILGYYTQPLPGASVPAVASLAQGYQLLHELSKSAGATYVLFLEGTVGGGTQRIRKNLFTNLFYGDLIRYSGGAVIAYGLLKLDTAVISPANTYRYVTPYTTIMSPRDVEESRVGDNLK